MRLTALMLVLSCVTPALAITVHDGAGDQLPGAPDPAYDISTIEAASSAGIWTFTLNFATSSTGGNLDWLGGYIDLDTDLNVGTGRPTHLEEIGSSMSMGVDYYVELIPQGSTVFLWRGDESLVGEYAFKTQASQASFSIPIPTSSFLLAAVFANNGTPTDRAPNLDEPYSIPEPSSMACFSLVSMLLWRKRSRKGAG